MDLPLAIKIIRRELVTKDEVIKAYQLLELFKNVKGLDKERKNTWGMMKHVFDEEAMLKAYKEVEAADCEQIEPEEIADNPAIKFSRYKWMMDEITQGKPKSYLDLGCYVGSLPIWAAKQGVRSYGVDFTPKVIEVARRRAKERGLTNVKFFEGDAGTFDKVKADYVSSFEVLEHIPDVEKYVENLSKLANKWVFLSTPDGPYGNGEGNIAQGWDWDGKGVRGHIRVFTRATMKRLLKGYKISNLFTDVGGLLCVKYRRRSG